MVPPLRIPRTPLFRSVFQPLPGKKEHSRRCSRAPVVIQINVPDEPAAVCEMAACIAYTAANPLFSM